MRLQEFVCDPQIVTALPRILRECQLFASPDHSLRRAILQNAGLGQFTQVDASGDTYTYFNKLYAELCDAFVGENGRRRLALIVLLEYLIDSDPYLDSRDDARTTCQAIIGQYESWVAQGGISRRATTEQPPDPARLIAVPSLEQGRRDHTAIATLAPSTQGRDATLDIGLRTVQELMERPEVREIVGEFRGQFQVARSRIDLVSDCKELHDAFHDLQTTGYGQLRLVRLSPSPEIRQVLIAGVSTSLKTAVDRVQAVAARRRVLYPDDLLPRRLGDTASAVQAAIRSTKGQANQEEAELLGAIEKLERLFVDYPVWINTQLVATARGLPLSELADAMQRIYQQLATADVPSQKVERCREGAAELSSLNDGLAALVTAHDQWQWVDVELRRVEGCLEVSPRELMGTWSDLKRQVEPLYYDCAEEWAVQLRDAATNLDRSIAAGNPAVSTEWFRQYRTGAGNRFRDVDKALLELCGNRLPQVGAFLEGILER